MKTAFLLVALIFPAAAARADGRPKDFDAFWNQVKSELAEVPKGQLLAPDPAHSDKDVTCYVVTYTSLKRDVHARYCRPARDGKFPAVLISPWYSQGQIDAPSDWARRGMAALWYQARGFEVDRSTYPLENSWYVLDGIDSPKTYAYREIVAHGLRGLDFLASRPEVDAKRIGAAGASQGGGLTLLIAGLDRRVRAAAADAPFLTDWPDSLAAPHSPYADVRKYLDEHPERRAKVLRTVSYFDTLDVVGRIRVPTLVEVLMQDRTCPPGGVEKAYDGLKSPGKKLIRYPTADHMNEGAARWSAAQDFLADALSAR